LKAVFFTSVRKCSVLKSSASESYLVFVVLL